MPFRSNCKPVVTDDGGCTRQFRFRSRSASRRRMRSNTSWWSYGFRIGGSSSQRSPALRAEAATVPAKTTLIPGLFFRTQAAKANPSSPRVCISASTMSTICKPSRKNSLSLLRADRPPGHGIRTPAGIRRAEPGRVLRGRQEEDTAPSSRLLLQECRDQSDCLSQVIRLRKEGVGFVHAWRVSRGQHGRQIGSFSAETPYEIDPIQRCRATQCPKAPNPLERPLENTTRPDLRWRPQRPGSHKPAIPPRSRGELGLRLRRPIQTRPISEPPTPAPSPEAPYPAVFPISLT